MLIYIIIRFKWRFAVAAIVAVFHDVFMLIAFYGFFHMTINNPFIAAILTVVGYSINDTIVIFDRIRENLHLIGRQPLPFLIDHSINQTLVRSLMTSITTVIAIVPLVILGGETVRGFAVPLMIGIICGTASSIFIASPIFYQLSQIGKGPQRGNAKGKKTSKYLENQAKLGISGGKDEGGQKEIESGESKKSANVSEAPKCPNCGADVVPGTKFCPNCGCDLVKAGVAVNGINADANGQTSAGAKGKHKQSRKKRNDSSKHGGAVV
jgi:SecD/SecF fusion protein